MNPATDTGAPRYGTLRKSNMAPRVGATAAVAGWSYGTRWRSTPRARLTDDAGGARFLGCFVSSSSLSMTVGMMKRRSPLLPSASPEFGPVLRLCESDGPGAPASGWQESQSILVQDEEPHADEEERERTAQCACRD